MEKKAYRGRMWRMVGKEPYVRGMWEHFQAERQKAKKFMKEAEKEKQEGIKGTRSVAAEITSQRILGASEILP